MFFKHAYGNNQENTQQSQQSQQGKEAEFFHSPLHGFVVNLPSLVTVVSVTEEPVPSEDLDRITVLVQPHGWVPFKNVKFGQK